MQINAASQWAFLVAAGTRPPISWERGPNADRYIRSLRDREAAMRKSVRRAAIIAFGMLVVLSAQARSQDFTRETIIHGVRDDVRRKIQEGSERAAGPMANHTYGRQWHHPPSPHGH
jgi:hypothetical protein